MHVLQIHEPHHQSNAGNPAGSDRVATFANACWASLRAISAIAPRDPLLEIVRKHQKWHSNDQNPMESSFWHMGNMSSVRIRVASKDWWASRNTVSVINTLLFAFDDDFFFLAIVDS